VVGTTFRSADGLAFANDLGTWRLADPAITLLVYAHVIRSTEPPPRISSPRL